MIQCTFGADGDATQQVIIMIAMAIFTTRNFLPISPQRKLHRLHGHVIFIYMTDKARRQRLLQDILCCVSIHLVSQPTHLSSQAQMCSSSFSMFFYQWRLSTITHKLYWLLLVTPIKILKVNHAERGQRVVYFEIGTGIRQFILDSYAGTCTAIETFTFSDTFPWATYQIRKIVAGACAGNARNDFTATDFKGNRELAIPACITARAWYTCRDACRDRWLALAGKTFPVVPGHVQPATLRMWQRAHAGQIIDFI